MQITKSYFLFIVVLTVCGCAQTTKPTRQYSFSCSKAKYEAERIICSSEDLRALDAKMTARYQRAIATTPDPVRLREEQRYWISEVRNNCQTRKCLYGTYETRIEDLQMLANNDDLDRRTSRSHLRRDYGYNSSFDNSHNFGYDNYWDGRWVQNSWNSDSSGMLRIKQINSHRLSFRLIVSSDRGRGEIMGEAPIEGNYVVYKDRSEGCELEMYLKGESIEINSNRRCEKYSDGRVNFDGRYRRD